MLIIANAYVLRSNHFHQLPGRRLATAVIAVDEAQLLLGRAQRGRARQLGKATTRVGHGLHHPGLRGGTVGGRDRPKAPLSLLQLPACALQRCRVFGGIGQQVHGIGGTAHQGGFHGLHFAGGRNDAQGKAQPVEATLVSGPANAVYLLAYASKDAAALQRARGSLQEAQGSFRPITAADRAAAKPWVVKTVPYPRGGFAELARTSPLGTPEQQLRLINGYYGGGEPAPGQLVKMIGL